MAPLENAKPSQHGDPPEVGHGSPAKREAILAAGAKVFMKQGFGNASMDEVARQAAVSKATIYSHFESKQVLFGAIMMGKCQAMIPAIAHATLGDSAPGQALRSIGAAFLDLIMSPETLPLYRVVLAEAPRFPDLGRTFYASGPERVASALADYFARQKALGTLDVSNPRLAAEQFFGMVLGHAHVRFLLGVTEKPLPSEERAHIVASAVKIFMEGAAKR